MSNEAAIHRQSAMEDAGEGGEMSDEAATYRRAEQAYLESEGIKAQPHLVDLKRLGGTTRVLVAGEGPPVLVVPGVMSTGVALAGVVRGLPDYRCIMIERPGTGLSPQLPDPPTNLDAHKRVGDALLVDVLDGLGIERSHIVTTSLGGWTTFRGAAAHPERFDHICAFAWLMGARVSAAPLSMRFPVPNALLPRRVRAPRRMIPAMIKAGGMGRAFKAGRFSNEMIEYMYTLLRRTETFRNDSIYNPRPFTTFGVSDDTRHPPELLSRVTHPVHLFWGTDDLFGNVDSAREFADLLPNATLQLVEDAQHAPWMDEPELAITAVRNHLRK